MFTNVTSDIVSAMSLDRVKILELESIRYDALAAVPDVTETLTRRFLPSTGLRIVYHGAKYPVEFPVLKAVPVTDPHAVIGARLRPCEAIVRVNHAF
jgi:hypothetical protein